MDAIQFWLGSTQIINQGGIQANIQIENKSSKSLQGGFLSHLKIKETNQVFMEHQLGEAALILGGWGVEYHSKGQAPQQKEKAHFLGPSGWHC